MKPTLFLIVLLYNNLSYAQENDELETIILNNTETSAIFNSNQSNSFVSLVRSKLWDFERYEATGITEEDMNLLSSSEIELLDSIIGPPGTEPILIDDPNSPNYGEPLIIIDDQGWQTFVYAPGDTLITTLDDISSIRIKYEIGNSPFEERIWQIQFYKDFKSETLQVLSFNANLIELLRFEGSQFVQKVPKEQQKELYDPTNKNCFWSELEDSCMANYKSALKNKFGPPYVNYLMPGNGSYSWLSHQQVDPYDLSLDTVTLKPIRYSIYDDLLTNIPYTISLNQDSIASVPSLFNKWLHNVKFTMFPGTIPLIETDPNSPNFGMELIVIDSLGQESFVYDPPAPEFYWIDFKPTIYILEQIIHGELNNRSYTVPTAVIFTTEIADNEEFISYMPITSQLGIKYFDAYTVKDLHQMEWYQLLKTALN